MDIDELLGIDYTDPSQQLARKLLDGEKQLLADLVKLRRDTKTQHEVAEMMGVTDTAITKIESGLRDLRLSTLRRYAHAVGADIKHSVDRFTPSHSLRSPAHFVEFSDSAEATGPSRLSRPRPINKSAKYLVFRNESRYTSR